MFLREMILKEQMLPMLAETCPTFAEKWEEHKKEYIQTNPENYYALKVRYKKLETRFSPDGSERC